MSKNTPYASLTPYLQQSRVCLAISLRSHDNDELERLSNPFVVVDDSSAIGRLLHGQFVTDGGTAIQELSLFVQRDQYRVVHNSLDPLTNRRIASLWQKAFDAYASRPDSGLVKLSALTNNNSLKTLSPLFFCKLRRHFFEPPCPTCGNLLLQCEDDTILQAAGLPPFSSSLRRYLYCEHCYQTGEGFFYVYEREMENCQVVRDRWELINSFSSLVEDPANLGHLPCNTCDRKKECFGAKDKALTRISIFSFYPFHMLPFKAMDIHCTDFLALLSGASCEEIISTLPPAHTRTSKVLDLKHNMEKGLPFFFGGEKHFLEVLYLKLAFLRQLADWVETLPLEGLSPLSSFSFDSFWVDLPEPADSLPYFWNFKVKPHGLIVCNEDKSFPAPLGLESKTDFLALAWFFVMLRNAKQDMQEVLDNLNRMFIDGSPLSTEVFLKKIESSFAHEFGPECVFWIPQKLEMPQDYKALWKSCMELGWRLLRARFDDPSNFKNMDYWIAEIDELKKRVKSALFGAEPSSDPSFRASREDITLDKEIGAVLTDIAARWEAKLLESIGVERQDLIHPTGPPKDVPTEGHEQQTMPPLEETIIIAPRGPKPPSEPKTSTPTQKDVAREDEIPETIIFSAPESAPFATAPGPTSTPAGPNSTETPSKGPQDEDFEKTLSLLDQELLGLVDGAPGEVEDEHDHRPSQDKGKKDEHIPETVIIRPKEQ